MKKLSLFIIAISMIACHTKQSEPITLTILHTNDTHSQVDPKTDNNLGGYARRMGYIDEQRAIDPELILLDAGDYWQGTPFFNFFNGRVEIDALNRMHYDAATLGNHEFDNGVDTLAAVLKTAEFPIVCANYKVTNTPLEDIVKPYVILKRKGLKIGVIGLCVNPEALIAKQNFAPLEYENPIPVANYWAEVLKTQKHCDVVIALSHLGTDISHGDTANICDRALAEQSRYIDLIIGGHTHKVVENEYVQNLDGRLIPLRQTGKSGVKVGKVTLTVE